MNSKELALRLKEHRRHLNAIPEIGDELWETKKYVLSVLENLSCKIEPVMNSGVIAYFDKGAKKTLAFRGDMDALPFGSGNKHACGHDAHTAMLLGFVEQISNQEDMPYNILLVFQPAEETTGGAKQICETGLFQKYNVKAAFGIHIWPNLPKGEIVSRPGALMAMSCEVNARICGQSCHAAEQAKGIDAIEAMAEFLTDIYRMTESEIPEGERVVLRAGKVEGGTARNILAGEATVYGTMRALSEEVFEFMKSRIREIGAAIEEKTGATLDLSFSEGYPTVINDRELYERLIPKLTQTDVKIKDEAVMIAEDFSYYGREVPAIFFFLGTGEDRSLHSENFDFDEEILIHGVRLYEEIVDKYT